MSPGLMRSDTGGLANGVYLSDPIISSKQQLIEPGDITKEF